YSDVVFIIKDSGIGIPQKELENLFDAFRRASNVGTIQGTGLGLAIVKRCVDLHKGKIFVESEVGLGTTFTVTLPYRSLPS
ncbi:MAG: HAMP domain-containing histidine kinase, partial [Merismopedia sp. SIO2A8]|nr:HAMP domain-containing histidine kinase [Merismopedia sp. SIO2A8]